MSTAVAEEMRSASTAWASAYVAALAELSELPRTKTARVETRGGGSYSYSYADLADVLTYVRPILAKHSLCVAQTIDSVEGAVGVRTWLWHAQGHVWSSGELSMQTSGLTPQQIGSAITYARRYSLLAMLGLATEEDDDGAAVSKPKSKTTKRTAKQSAAGDDSVRMMSQQQQETISDQFAQLDLAGDDLRDARRALIVEVLGRQITSTAELTNEDAAKLIVALDQAIREAHERVDDDV